MTDRESDHEDDMEESSTSIITLTEADAREVFVDQWAMRWTASEIQRPSRRLDADTSPAS